MVYEVKLSDIAKEDLVKLAKYEPRPFSKLIVLLENFENIREQVLATPNL